MHRASGIGPVFALYEVARGVMNLAASEDRASTEDERFLSNLFSVALILYGKKGMRSMALRIPLECQSNKSLR